MGKALRAANEWNHESISTAGLAAALEELNGFPRISTEGKLLGKRGAVAIKIRTALLVCEVEQAATWAPLADLLDAMPEGDPELDAFDELKQARLEFIEARDATEAAVLLEIGRNRAVRVTGGRIEPTSPAAMAARWGHSKIQTAPLVEAVSQCESFPRPTPKALVLVARAKQVARVRDALRGCVWKDSKSWGGLIACLEEVSAALSTEEVEEAEELEEVRAAKAEVDDMRTGTELGMQAALGSGRSVKKDTGGWDHSAVSNTAIEAALVQLEGFPRPSATGKKLGKEAKLVIKVREAILKADWASAASWAPLSTLLDELPSEDAEQTEVEAARRERKRHHRDLNHAVRGLHSTSRPRRLQRLAAHHGNGASALE